MLSGAGRLGYCGCEAARLFLSFELVSLPTFLVKHQVMNDRLGNDVIFGKFHCHSGLIVSDDPTVHLAVQGFIACPYAQIEDHRALRSGKLSLVYVNGDPSLADIFYVAMAITGARMGNIDIDQYLVTFCFSSFHGGTPDLSQYQGQDSAPLPCAVLARLSVRCFSLKSGVRARAENVAGQNSVSWSSL